MWHNSRQTELVPNASHYARSYELKTGKLVYREPIVGGNCTASPMVTDNRFYLVADYSEFRAAKARAGSNAAPVCEYYDGFSFGKFVNAFPQLRGRVTDLFIGDLFDSEVDEVWGPLESLYPPQKLAIPEWNAGGQPEDAPDEVNELYLPAGELR